MAIVAGGCPFCIYMKTYVIKNKRTGLLKIGRSKNPKQRIYQIDQIRGDCELIIEIDKDCESLLHHLFYKSHVSGEWFLLSDKDLIDIEGYKNGNSNFTIPFNLGGITFEIIKSNYFIELKPLRNIMNDDFIFIGNNLGTSLNTTSIQEFIYELSKKYGQVVSNKIGNRNTWVHILLFLEMAKTVNAKIKIEIYEMLMGLGNPEVHELVKKVISIKSF